MATVRIYKVAELLGTTSQEVSALLKRDHGIEVKSASSTIEEVVARQFVERLAKQRNIQLPSGDIFAETPVVKGKKGGPAKKPAEPPKPVAPALPPPRLVKTIKPPVAAAPPAPPVETEEPVPIVAEPPPPIERPTPEIAHVAAAVVEAPPPEVVPEPRIETPSAPSSEIQDASAPAVSQTPPPAPQPPAPKPPTPGRVVPPTLRLRIEQLHRAAARARDLDDRRQDIAQQLAEVAPLQESLADAVQAHDGRQLGAELIFQPDRFLLPGQALQSKGDVLGDGEGEPDLVGGELVRLVVVEHELAEQLALRH